MALIIGGALALAPGAMADTLRRALEGEPHTLDPAYTTLDYEAAVAHDLFEGLLIHDPDGRLVPGVARAWSVSPDGLTWTFELRNDARWSDASPVTAHDFVFSLRRLVDPARPTPWRAQIQPLRCAEEVIAGRAPADRLGVVADGPLRLRIMLKEPTPWLPHLVAQQSWLPVNPANVARDGDSFTKPGKLVSNGAYKLERLAANGDIVLRRNRHFHDAWGVNIDSVAYTPAPDSVANVRAFDAGLFDIVPDFSPEDYLLLRAAKADPLRVGELHIVPALRMTWYAFDTRRAPFDDARVRRALAMAIDRSRLSADVEHNLTEPAFSPVPDGMPDYGLSARPEFAGQDQTARLAGARRLLAEAGYAKRPLVVTIRLPAEPSEIRLATAIADMWRSGLNASVSLIVQERRLHMAHLRDGGAFDVASTRWTADFPEAGNFLRLFTSSNPAFNYSHYASSRYDDLMRRADRQTDQEKRRALMHEAEKTLLQDMPVAPIARASSRWLVSQRVKGWRDNRLNTHPSRFLSLQAPAP